MPGTPSTAICSGLPVHRRPGASSLAWAPSHARPFTAHRSGRRQSGRRKHARKPTGSPSRRGTSACSAFRVRRSHRPTLGDALNAGYRYLEVKCLGCDTHQTVALDIVRRPKTTPVHELERYMRCKDCSRSPGLSLQAQPSGRAARRPRSRRAIRPRRGGRASDDPTMRVIFSRKGFDSAAGKAPSPIINGVPISLPIPTKNRSETSYRLAGFGEIVEQVTKGRIGADDLCHEDPYSQMGVGFSAETGAAQPRLEKNGVDVGDVFLFFGLFASPEGRDRHHRIFGYLEVDEVRRLGERPGKNDDPAGFCDGIRILSASGTRTIRSISAPEQKRRKSIPICVSPSRARRPPSGTSHHGSNVPG